jgi:hypothetical protein
LAYIVRVEGLQTASRTSRVVNFLADQAVDFIKVYNNITENELAAIIKAAHAREVVRTGNWLTRAQAQALN